MMRQRGKNREETILRIVKTDNTFTLSPAGWVGRCIHCNTKLIVTVEGRTAATVEHIRPLCDDGDPYDPVNLALACSRCNNEKGIRHDRFSGRGGRADEVIAELIVRRRNRWRDGVS